jgi:hypothetical protein
MRRVYEIDGLRFSTLAEFFDEIGRVMLPGVDWGKSLDAFADVLSGGFGTPEEGYIIRWANSHISRQRLGYAETVRELQFWLAHCHPTGREAILKRLDDARRHQGATVFDWLVEIIEREGGVDLELG